jgi:hypothetical protein
VSEVAAPYDRGCKPKVIEAATPCDRGCNPSCPRFFWTLKTEHLNTPVGQPTWDLIWAVDGHAPDWG